MQGVLGLIRSAYRKSSNPSMIQFEVFLTTNQDSTMIQNLQLTNEYLDNSWSIRLHLFDQNDVDIYVNRRWKGNNSQRHLKNANNYVRFILFKLLPDVDYCFWMDADIAWNKDVIDFVMEKTRTDIELKKLKRSREEQKREYGLPGKSFRTKFVAGAFPQDWMDIQWYAYKRLKKLNIHVQDKPSFNAGFVLLNLKLWRMKNIDKLIISIMKANNKFNILGGKLASQPALTLACGGKNLFKFDTGAWRKALGVFPNVTISTDDVYILHWNGEHKPWRADGFNKNLWMN